MRYVTLFPQSFESTRKRRLSVISFVIILQPSKTFSRDLRCHLLQSDRAPFRQVVKTALGVFFAISENDLAEISFATETTVGEKQHLE